MDQRCFDAAKIVIIVEMAFKKKKPFKLPSIRSFFYFCSRIVLSPLDILKNHCLIEKKKMRFCKSLLLAVLIMLFAFDGFAQNAVLNSCYVVHKDKDMEGKESGMRFHLNLSINGKKDQKVWCIIEMAYYEGEDSYYFAHPKGNFEYNGHLAVYKQLTPIYDNTTWNDLQLFLPYGEFRNSLGEVNWQKGITYCVKVVDNNGKVLLQQWQNSKRMGYSQHFGQYMKCHHCSGNSYCKTCNGLGTQYIPYRGRITCQTCKGTGKNRCLFCGGTGQWRLNSFSSYDIQVNNGNSYSSGSAAPAYYDTPPTSSGESHNKPDYTCPICNGTGKCTNCAGRGVKDDVYISGGGTHQCSVCNGRGVCSYCNGRGYTYR